MNRCGLLLRLLLVRSHMILCASLVVILQFDGSLRPPHDPGFPSLPIRFATCASSISIASASSPLSSSSSSPSSSCNNKSLKSSSFKNMNTQIENVDVWAIGGRFISLHNQEVGMVMTSAQTEYEGLLLGLEWLLSPSSSTSSLLLASKVREKTNSDIITEMDKSDTISDTAKNVLIIRGDCKTVIDQLKGKSLPRKLQLLHKRAKGKIKQLLSNSYNKDEIDNFKNKNQLGKTMPKILFNEVHYEHIPRTENILCDKVCKEIVNFHIWKNTWNIILQDIQNLEAHVSSSKPFAPTSLPTTATVCADRNNNHNTSSTTTTITNPASRPINTIKNTTRQKRHKYRATPTKLTTTPLHQLLSKHFEELAADSTKSIDTTKSLIRYSLRPNLFYKLADLAMKLNDFRCLVKIGRLLEQESRRYTNGHPDVRDILLHRAIHYQIQGLKMDENLEFEQSKVDKLDRKLRHLALKQTRRAASSASNTSPVVELEGEGKQRRRLDSPSPSSVDLEGEESCHQEINAHSEFLKDNNLFLNNVQDKWRSLVQRWFQRGIQFNWVAGSTLWIDNKELDTE